MTITATNRSAFGNPLSRARRRVPAVTALAVAAGIALSGCAADEQSVPPEASTQAATTSSSSSSTTKTPAPVAPTTEAATDPVAVTSAAPTPLPEVPAELPAVVVDAGGPCHRIGDLAQAMDGSPLFCLNDPQAGPLWLPQPTAAPGQQEPALVGQPCIQQDASVTAPDGTLLSCRLSGDGSTPGGLFWRS